jgi:hypothetical protein
MHPDANEVRCVGEMRVLMSRKLKLVNLEAETLTQMMQEEYNRNNKSHDMQSDLEKRLAAMMQQSPVDQV